MHPDGHPFLQAQTGHEVRDVITLLADPDRRSAIGHASRQWVLDHHDRSVVARKVRVDARGTGAGGTDTGGMIPGCPVVNYSRRLNWSFCLCSGSPTSIVGRAVRSQVNAIVLR